MKEFALEGNSDRAAAGKNSNSSPQEQQLTKDQPGTSNQQSAENGERPLQSPIDFLKEEVLLFLRIPIIMIKQFLNKSN